MDIQLEKEKRNPRRNIFLNIGGGADYSSAVGLDYFRQSCFYIESRR